MKIVLPVAGKGTRLRPHTHTRAKSLVHVAGKTVLEHIIERLRGLPADEFLFITDDNGEQIRACMEQRFPELHCRYLPQRERLGPAHAVGLAAPHVAPGDDLLIVFSDTVFVADLARIPVLCADCDGLVYSKEVEDYQRFGVNVLRDGFIVDMVEKPATPVSKLAQAGLYYLKDGAGFMAHVAATIAAGETVQGEYYLPAVFMRMLRAGLRLRAPELDAWLDCGKPETLLATNRYLLQERQCTLGRAVDSVLIPPVYLGAGAEVRHSIVGPNVSIADGSVVEASIISDSIVNLRCEVRNQLLTGTILGDEVRLVGAPRRMNIGDHSLIEMQD